MTEPDQNEEGFVLPPGIYDKLNKLVRVILPAVATFYFTLSEIWGFPYGKAVVGSITAAAFLFGQIVHKSAKNYKKAEKDVDILVPENPYPRLDLKGRDRIVVKVDPTMKTRE